MKDLCEYCGRQVKNDDEDAIHMPDLNGGQDGLVAHARCDERMGWDIPAIFYALLFIAWITWDYIVHRFFGCKLCNNPLSKEMPLSLR